MSILVIHNNNLSIRVYYTCYHDFLLQAYDSDDFSVNNTNYSSAVDYGLTTLHEDITPLQGIAVETVLTLLVVMVYIHTTMEGGQDDTQGGGKAGGQPPARNPIAPLAVGFALAAGIMSRLAEVEVYRVWINNPVFLE